MASSAPRSSRRKGTDRSRFFRGQVDKYTWVDVGSSFLLSEIERRVPLGAARARAEITAVRLRIWERYHEAFAELERLEVVRRPVVPDECEHNAHLYYLLLANQRERDALLQNLAVANVSAVFHFVPLHSSEGGRRFGRPHADLSLTTDVSERLIRLPLWPDMTTVQVERVIEAVLSSLTATALVRR